MAMVEYFLIFALGFPLVMFLPDLILWGTGYAKVQGIVNDTAQTLGEQGGADEDTVLYLQEVMKENGLDPAKWDLTLTAGPLPYNQKGGIALESTYTFNSLRAFGMNFSVPVYATATYVSQVWIR